MAAALVTYEQLIARPGFSDADQAQAEALLEDASALVRVCVAPDLDDVEPPEVPGAVVAVVVNMVRRGLTNPRGLTQETLGDYSYSSGGTSGSASLYLTNREKRIIRKAVGKLGVATVQLEGDLPLIPELISSDQLIGT